MASENSYSLGSGYTYEVDVVEQQSWYGALREFADANIYQTWSYGEILSGGCNLSHVLLKKDGQIAAAAQARIAKVPFLNLGMAYVRWGPLCVRCGAEANLEVFRYAVRALREEFVLRRGLTLRLFPILFDDGSPNLATILAEEGLYAVKDDGRERTMLMDLGPSVDILRAGVARNWKRNLKEAEQNNLEVVEGTEDELFDQFIALYKGLVVRKGFAEPNDINQFRSMQAGLPEDLKMKIALCRSAGKICAGLVWSAMGNTGIELFAATNETGLQSKGSYLLRWRLLTYLKANRFRLYDLNGINPVANPGGYKFKHELAGKNGRDVHYLGRFDCHANSIARACIALADRLRTMRWSLRRLVAKVGHAAGLLSTAWS
jgi:lipid II:glycine glycyltransferase (peptidoglycan interpeptide bridge formation enzyme)